MGLGSPRITSTGEANPWPEKTVLLYTQFGLFWGRSWEEKKIPLGGTYLGVWASFPCPWLAIKVSEVLPAPVPCEWMFLLRL